MIDEEMEEDDDDDDVSDTSIKDRCCGFEHNSKLLF
jgi:hypothetical protein